MLQQVDQQIEHLGLERNDPTATAQLTEIGIENVIVEAESHEQIFSKETIKTIS
jgi:hypothetical protein